MKGKKHTTTVIWFAFRSFCYCSKQYKLIAAKVMKIAKKKIVILCEWTATKAKKNKIKSIHKTVCSSTDKFCKWNYGQRHMYIQEKFGGQCVCVLKRLLCSSQIHLKTIFFSFLRFFSNIFRLLFLVRYQNAWTNWRARVIYNIQCKTH